MKAWPIASVTTARRIQVAQIPRANSRSRARGVWGPLATEAGNWGPVRAAAAPALLRRSASIHLEPYDVAASRRCQVTGAENQEIVNTG